MTAPAPISVLVVDDDPFVRRGVAEIFRATPDIRVVADAEDGDQVARAVAQFRPCVVLMDLKMRRMGGLEATRRLCATPGAPKVVAMTAMDVDDLVLQAIAAGAYSFIGKDAAPETFHQSIRAVAAGNTLFSAEALRQLVVAAAVPARPTGILKNLTDRERDVLRILADGATNSDIADQLFLGETTVKTHVSAIFTKLGVRNRVEAAAAAFRSGLVA